jgi:dTDP-4-dehydrorhamnose 3,5-epimerase
VKQTPARETETLARAAPEPVRDGQTVTPDGEPVRVFPAGVTVRDIKTHADDRGTVFELFDPRWGWHPAPLVFSYCFTVRPGMVKGWGVHHDHDDRYALLFGEMKTVLYDDRPESETYRAITEVMLTEHRRQLLSIPPGVWHANHNVGSTEVVVVNFPTIPYDHANPEKFRLPLDTDQIPYRFEAARGGW